MAADRSQSSGMCYVTIPGAKIFSDISSKKITIIITISCIAQIMELQINDPRIRDSVF